MKAPRSTDFDRGYRDGLLGIVKAGASSEYRQGHEAGRRDGARIDAATLTDHAPVQ